MKILTRQKIIDLLDKYYIQAENNCFFVTKKIAKFAEELNLLRKN